MKVEALPSPNFNDRRFPVDMLVLHYTGMETGQDALDRMRDAEAGVSAHYMIWEDGRVVQLVGEDKRAWHAGVSSWQGDEDLNSRSIGIEIVNGGHDWPQHDGALPAYPDGQIRSVIELCRGIRERWEIPHNRIVGHSDIAPARKADPGEHFPWTRLAAVGIGLCPDAVEPAMIAALEPGETGEAVAVLQAALQQIGYGIDVSATYDPVTQAVIRAFQRRWVQDSVTGLADARTQSMIDLVSSAFRA